MVASLIFKGILFYILYRLVKGALNVFSIYKKIQTSGKSARGNDTSHSSSSGGSAGPGTGPGRNKGSEKGTVEAEYRVIRERD